ncbi:hypothetical protein RB595_007216 [Gaeumannomyces hyphopodioides]
MRALINVLRVPWPPVWLVNDLSKTVPAPGAPNWSLASTGADVKGPCFSSQKKKNPQAGTPQLEFDDGRHLASTPLPRGSDPKPEHRPLDTNVMRQPTASLALRATLQLGLGSRHNGSLLCAAAISRHRLLGLAPRSGHNSRSSSSSSSPAAQQPSSPPSSPPQSPTPSPSLAAIAEAVNPPASTRPPPLDLPEPDPKATAMKRVFGVGKAYLVFYKNGLRAILTNYRLNQAVLGQPAGGAAPPPPLATDGTPTAPRRQSRAALQLGERVGHDLRRVPVFLLIFAVFVELTPLVAVLVPRLVPLTCRIPKQELLLLRQAEDRRRASFDDLAALLLQPGGAATIIATDASAPGPSAAPAGTQRHSTRTAALAVPETREALDAADRHVARSLGLVSRAWDWGWVGGVPAALARRRVSSRLPVLALDDRKMLEAAAAALAAEALGKGGRVAQQAVVDAAVEALVDDEVRIACAARAVDTLGRPVEELRPVLAHWLRLVAEAGEDPFGPMRELLLSKPGSWPQTIPPGRKEKLVLHMPVEADQM